jgi:hypothetical protein
MVLMLSTMVARDMAAPPAPRPSAASSSLVRPASSTSSRSGRRAVCAAGSPATRCEMMLSTTAFSLLMSASNARWCCSGSLRVSCCSGLRMRSSIDVMMLAKASYSGASLVVGAVTEPMSYENATRPSTSSVTLSSSSCTSTTT